MKFMKCERCGGVKHTTLDCGVGKAYVLKSWAGNKRARKSKLRVGDHVTRPVYLDDDTWALKGDACLPRSPLKHGVVLRVQKDEVVVGWLGSGEIQRLLPHGVDEVNETTASATPHLV